ncbi:sensor histidine kinase [Niabella aquatica]
MSTIRQNKNFWAYTIFIASFILFIGSFFFKSFSFNQTNLDQRIKEFEQIIHKQEADAAAVLNDTALVKRLAQARETVKDLEFLYNKPYCFYVYKKSKSAEYLTFWNTALIIIPDSTLKEVNNEKLLKLDNGYYYVKRMPYKYDTGINIFCAILIQSHFYNENAFFQNTFPLSAHLNRLAEISNTPTDYQVKSLSGQTTLYLKEKAGAIVSTDTLPVVVIRLLSCFFIFLSIYFILFRNVVRRYKSADIPLFVLIILIFRILLYIFPGTFNLGSLDLFKHVAEANPLLPSLGDLLINSLLFCWIGVFIWNRMRPNGIEIPVRKRKIRWLPGIFYIMLLLLLTFSTVNVTRSIISDYKVSFDVTNFFSLSIYTAVGFIILAFLSLGFHYFSRILYHYIFPAFKNNGYWIYLLIATAGLSYTALITSKATEIYLLCLVWLLLYTFLFNHEVTLNKLIRFNISGTVVWIFVFSVSISILMLSEINRAELAQRKTYLKKLDTTSDPATERLMGMANIYLDNDFFQDNFNRLYNHDENQYLRDSILSNNYFRYIKDYRGTLYFYDSTNAPLYNDGNLSYESLNHIISRDAVATSLPDLYVYEPSYDNFVYITVRRVKNEEGALIGSVFILSQPKKYTPVTITPELFRQKKDWEFSNSAVYNYAIYTNKLLTSSSKKYPFTSTLEGAQIPKTAFELRENNGFSELWYRASNKRIIVMVRKNERLLETITLFSYLFCAFLFLVALIQIMSNLINLFLNRGLLKKRLQFSTSIRGQIHNTFILITLLSFVVIGIATISFFTQRFDDANSDRLGRTMSIMLNEMQSHKELGTLVYDKDDSMHTRKLDEIIRRVADIHGVDVNVYNIKGILIASSQPDVYQRGILSKQIDPRAYYYLLRLRHIEHTQKEKVAELKYTSMYAPLRNEQGSLYGYLSIPYFISEQVLNQEISRFLITLINLNAFIFLITGLVALLITNRITHSFALIRDKLMEVNLSRNNEMIVWERNDEIGSLVSEYNKMVTKLQVSADALAKSERQEAWREMARQVAHEIKNPLTPMKLSLQYLQKSIDNNSPNVQQLTVSVSKTIVEQIDHLSKIASDFSQFANINQVITEIFDLHEVIQPLVVIYSKNPDVEFIWKPLPHPVNIFADKTQMNRVFTNLLGNAIEAARPEGNCRIEVYERIADKKVYVSISDNGVGIADAMKNKIFTPNFTTKSSGTGLGLAMCKTIVEQAGGDISFETSVDSGTTFHIELPLVV